MKIDSVSEEKGSMMQETEFLIRVLSDYIAKRPSTAQNDIDWDMIARVSRIHQIDGIVYYQCKSFIPTDQIKTFEKAFQATIFSYYMRQSVAQSLTGFLDTEQVPFFFVKGLVIAGYYPVPELRSMGDLDIIIHREDFRKTNAFFQNNGFSLKSDLDDREWQYYKDGMEYELHDRLIYSEIINKPNFQPFFNDAWSYIDQNRLDVSFHFLFLMVHLYKHLLNCGVGFRQFLDIALMAKNEPALDWTWICEKLDDLDLSKFASSCAGFLERWFHVRLPVRQEPIHDDFFEYATNQIFLNGVFGFENEENKPNQVFHSVAGSKYKKGKMILNSTRYLFPAYRVMKTMKFCSYLNGRPWLLPVAWGHRFCRVLSDKHGASNSLRSQFASSEQLDHRDEYFKNWGM